MAEYLHRELPARGFIPRGEPFYEDWGLGLSLENEEFPVMLGCGNQDEDEYLIFIEPSEPTITKGLFRKKIIDTTPVLVPLAEAIEAIVRAHPDSREICWE